MEYDQKDVQRALNLPNSIIKAELEGLYGSAVLEDMREVIHLYDVYEHGTDFNMDKAEADYIPADLRYKVIRALIDKEARFLFSRSPDIWVDVEEGDSPTQKEHMKQQYLQQKE